MKSRVKKLERETLGGEPLVVLFSTFYEGKNGETEAEYNHAVIVWGGGKTATACRRKDETQTAFSERLDGYEKLSWEQAKSDPVLSLPNLKGGEA